MKAAALFGTGALALATTGCAREPGPEPVRVAAASDLTAAFGDLGARFERETGHRIVFTFGSTGLLAKQLREGAPFDVFAAASASFVDDVVAAGACDGATKAPYARGRVAVWSKKGKPVPASLADFADARFGRVAIANPEHAPYGLAAKQALEKAGAWSALEPRLVLAENVRQALQFAETGNADAALVAWALVVNDHENAVTLVDEAEHAPIEQALVVCTRGARRAGGEAFARYVNSEPGRAVLREYGFARSGEPAAGPKRP